MMSKTKRKTWDINDFIFLITSERKHETKEKCFEIDIFLFLEDRVALLYVFSKFLFLIN